MWSGTLCIIRPACHLTVGYCLDPWTSLPTCYHRWTLHSHYIFSCLLYMPDRRIKFKMFKINSWSLLPQTLFHPEIPTAVNVNFILLNVKVKKCEVLLEPILSHQNWSVILVALASTIAMKFFYHFFHYPSSFGWIMTIPVELVSLFAPFSSQNDPFKQSGVMLFLWKIWRKNQILEKIWKAPHLIQSKSQIPYKNSFKAHLIGFITSLITPPTNTSHVLTPLKSHLALWYSLNKPGRLHSYHHVFALARPSAWNAPLLWYPQSKLSHLLKSLLSYAFLKKAHPDWPV